ncbi:MAG: hypothetical protein KIT46_04755 [Anaerolineales bacterium]|nr:hypothetical protein [Anaerolineales bacterium]MCW5855341.1 hypothetical protein [Anaerolineales bacterium]
MLDDLDLDIPEAGPPPKKPANRGFITIVAVMGGLMLLALLAMVYYAMVVLPQQRAALPQATPAVELTETQIVAEIQATGSAQPTNTGTPEPSSTNTPRPTATETLVPTQITPIFTSAAQAAENDATATVHALLTQAALAQTEAVAGTPEAGEAASGEASATPTATVTPSALPQSGFADEVGVPGLLAAAAMLLFLIFTARRLRTA